MSTITVRNALKINNLPELACFESFEDLLKALPDFYSVEIPTTITNVIISSTEPDDSQKNDLWIKYDNSGSFIGLFLFTGGAWNQIYPAPNEIFWMFGDSNVIPAGYQLVDASNANFTSAEVEYLQQFFYPEVILGRTPWNPSTGATAPLTIGTIVTNYASFLKERNECTFQINVSGVLGGVAGPYLFFSLPFNFASSAIGGPCTVFIAGVPETGYWTVTGNATVIVRRETGANYPNAGTVSFMFEASYETTGASASGFTLFMVTRSQF